jgi:hypothetical protein
MLGDKAYDSAELRDELHERGTKPVIPNRSNRKQPFSFSKRLYKLRWRIGVSSEGHAVMSVKVRPEPKDSGSEAREAPWPQCQCGCERAVGEDPVPRCARPAPPTTPSNPAPRRPHQPPTRIQEMATAASGSV